MSCLRKQASNPSVANEIIDQALIGVGRTGLVPGPSPLRTVRAVFPHTALRLVVNRRTDWRAASEASLREKSPCSAK